MKLHLPLGLLASLMACFSTVHLTVSSATDLTPPAVTADSIAFIGDSITNGSAYRQSIFKNFIDNKVTFKGVGEKTSGEFDYLGQRYDGKNSGYTSWTASDLAGTTASCPNFGGGPGHAYLANWLGLTDVKQGGVAGYTGPTYNPATALIMAGTNDFATYAQKLPDGTASTAATLNAFVQSSYTEMIAQLKKANPNVKIYIAGAPVRSGGGAYPLPTTGAYTGSNYYDVSSITYKAMADIENQKKLGYTFIDTNRGIEGVNHRPDECAFALSDGLHPNAQGALIIAGNMARAMGTGQRNAGLARKAASTYAGKINMGSAPSVTGTAWIKQTSGGKDSFLVNSASPSYYQQSWSATPATGFSCELSLQMFAAGANNSLTINLGSGANNGQLNIFEDKISWGTSTLYAASNLGQVNDFRISYIGATGGAANGYYVWLNGILIGEALAGGAGGSFNGLQIGNVSGSSITYAGITNIVWDTTGAFASDYSSLKGTAGATDQFGSEHLTGFDVLPVPAVPGEVTVSLTTATATWTSTLLGATAWTEGNSAKISARAEGTTLEVKDGTRTVSGLTLTAGSLIITGDGLSMAGVTSILSTATGSTLTLANRSITGASIALTNAGTLNLNVDTTLSLASMTNTGVLNIGNGTKNANLIYTPKVTKDAAFNAAGTINIASGSSLAVTGTNGQTITMNGLAGTGTLEYTSGGDSQDNKLVIGGDTAKGLTLKLNTGAFILGLNNEDFSAKVGEICLNGAQLYTGGNNRTFNNKMSITTSSKINTWGGNFTFSGNFTQAVGTTLTIGNEWHVGNFTFTGSNIALSNLSVDISNFTINTSGSFVSNDLNFANGRATLMTVSGTGNTSINGVLSQGANAGSLVKSN
ncbi:MAG: GDSL-type esterase/lipase family protein, partial [Akkermansia sp.]